MGDPIVISEKDKVSIRRDRTGAYNVAEVVIHDKDTANLLRRANELLGQLRSGKPPFIKGDPTAPTSEYVCQTCGARVDTYDEQPELIRFGCNSPTCKGYVRTWKKVKREHQEGECARFQQH